jgi:2-keto-4-pentenoate hydratase
MGGVVSLGAQVDATGDALSAAKMARMEPVHVESAEAGYGIARKLHAERLAAGWRPVGRKIGFTNRAIWPRYGVYQPIFGFVYDRTLTFAPDGAATVNLAGLAQPRIEPEICFGLKAAPPRSKDPAEILASIEWVAHSIEIVQCTLPGWQMKVGDSTAANGLHGALVVGRKVPVSSLDNPVAQLPALRVVLKKGTTVIDRGTGANVLDSPLNALAHLVDLLSTQLGFAPLSAGEIISTGTMTDAAPVASGETWSTEFEGDALAGIAVRFE